MALVLTAGPAAEPISLAEAKAHLRLDSDAEDALVGSLIVTSRLHVESATGLALVTQSWSYFLDAWPRSRCVRLPLRPLQSVTAVQLYDEAGTATVLAPATYTLDGAGTPARLVQNGGAIWPKPGRRANGIEIAFTAGFGAAAADVPAPIRHAVLILVAHWYEHRSPFEFGGAVEPIPHMVSELLSPFRARRL